MSLGLIQGRNLLWGYTKRRIKMSSSDNTGKPIKTITIDKEHTADFLNKLIKSYRVVAPVNNEKMIRFQEISSSDEIETEYTNTLFASKEILFPQTEVLFTVKKKYGKTVIEEPAPIEKDWIIFGVRPCDAQGLENSFKVFASGLHKDKAYLEKRERTIVIGLACDEPMNTCFCTSVGGSPSGRVGMDMLFTDLGDKYYVEVLTERGLGLIDQAEGTEQLSEKDLDEAKGIWESAEKSIKKIDDIEKLEAKLEEMFDDPIWDDLSQKCIGCGTCAFMCPTCLCFDILDEETPEGVKRIRIWDTCQFPLFTLHGSGHNPRPSSKERVRQRVMHKFCYFPHEHGHTSCVGCGRCIRECPVDYDVRETLIKLQEA
jgi:sulfhydrogenase subunit beta (sulfur reductase)